jgi:hypothetical protein
MQAVTLLVALALSVPLLQDKAAPKLPKKGDTIVVKGCLRGSALEATETSNESGDATTLRPLVYRLTGNKDTLKKLREAHDGSVVEVTGTLKSTLPMDEERGTTIGRTRVRIGVGSGSVGSQANPEASRSIPVLDVKTYEGVAVKCGG